MTDVYDLPRLRQMADAVESEASELDDLPNTFSVARPTPRIMQWVQTAGRGAAVHLRGAAVDRLAAHGELDPAAVPGIRLPP